MLIKGENQLRLNDEFSLLNFTDFTITAIKQNYLEHQNEQ